VTPLQKVETFLSATGSEVEALMLNVSDAVVNVDGKTKVDHAA
jgi:hypothetical protein